MEYMIESSLHFLDKTLDYGKPQQLVSSIIEELGRSRDEKSFEQIFQTIANFCQKAKLISRKDQNRIDREFFSMRFRDSVISTIVQRDDNQNEEYYRTYIYYQWIDNILVELEDRFSSKSLQILSGISSLCPDSDMCLDFDSLKPFSHHLNFDLHASCNELMVVKLMLENKSLVTIIDLYQELYSSKQAFPVLFELIESVIAIPVSSATCERTFSKIEMIKTTIRNNMGNDWVWVFSIY